MKILTLSLCGALLASPVMAQTREPARAPARATGVQQNNTGGEADAVISRGPTGADTATSNSAAGGNASRPEQAVPNGSANGGGGGR